MCFIGVIDLEVAISLSFRISYFKYFTITKFDLLMASKAYQLSCFITKVVTTITTFTTKMKP